MFIFLVALILSVRMFLTFNWSPTAFLPCNYRFDFYSFVFCDLNFPGARGNERKIYKRTASMAMVHTVKSRPMNSQPEYSIKP